MPRGQVKQLYDQKQLAGYGTAAPLPGVHVRVIGFLCILLKFSMRRLKCICMFPLPPPIPCGSGEHTELFGHLAFCLSISLKSFHISKYRSTAFFFFF